MVKIMSNQGYPEDNEVLTRVDYFPKVTQSEGGILIVGKDSQGREYKPKNEPAVRSSYVLRPGKSYRVPIGNDPRENHPALFFPFELRHNLSCQEIVEANKRGLEEFLSKFDLTL